MAKNSVTRTAADALLAKWSSLDAGYLPVGEHSQVYKKLLQQMSTAALAREGIRQNRQSPLINAGYAARIACMTSAVESFLSYHKSATLSTNPPLQVVILGCGLDILGLWTLSQSPNSIKLFEIDTHDVVKAKKELLESFRLLKVTSTESEGGTIVVKGRLVIETGTNTTQNEISNYTLASCDLKDISSVEKALANVDRSVPTIVLSELVLAYLGRQGIDDLLQWCASNICAFSGSAFVAYESLGASNNVVRSVVDGYKHGYSTNFREKLERGRAAQDGNSANSTDVFHPLGNGSDAVKKRCTVSGFAWCQSGLAGTVAAFSFSQDASNSGGRSFRPREPFDEHAALALHLYSCVFACAFPEQTDIDLIRCMCPWSTVSTYDMQPTVIQADDGSDFCIRPIEAADQEQVQTIFFETYKGISEQSPSVRKLVKGALNTSLKFSPNEVHSSIGLRYQTSGGIFLVAVRVSGNDTDESSSPSSVLGCIGLRRCEGNEDTVRGGGIPNTFSIHHLAVEAAARGKGIGTALLRLAETEFIQNETNGAVYRIVVVTLTLLEKANLFYKSKGFILEEQETKGDLTYNTYTKEVVPSKQE